MIDIIGDVHGHAEALTYLLKNMGYVKKKGSYRHPENQTIFVGDLINKGPESTRTLKLVRAMVDSGQAKVVLGNHELNFIIHFYAKSLHAAKPLKWSNGYGYFQKIYSEFYFKTKAVKEWVNWCQQLPLAIELDELRVAHACWHPESLETIKQHAPDLRCNDQLIQAFFEKESAIIEALFLTTKGIEVITPKYMPLGKKKLSRPGRIKVKWWNIDGQDFGYHALATNPKKKFPDIELPIPPRLLKLSYPSDEKPLFMGHYNLNQQPAILRPNLTVLDFSLKKEQRLVAYRYQGEKELSNSNLVIQ